MKHGYKTKSVFDGRAAPTESQQPASGPTRRRFLAAGATLGTMLGAPLLASCIGDGADDPPPDPLARTLFFDLSHHDATDRTYFLVGGGQRYALVSVADKPEVLAAARKTNAFLAEVPDARITHHVEQAVFSATAPTLTYLASAAGAGGVWSMAAVYLQIPIAGVAHAYAQARVSTPTGPLPMSVYRGFYGVRAAASEQDLIDERVLLGPPSHAASIIGAHPELFSLETNSAHHIHGNHIAPDPDTQTIAFALTQPQYGPATPELTPGSTNDVGWATLMPVIDDTTGQPYVNTLGKNRGCNQYLPRLHPDLAQVAGPAMARVTASVSDDPSLGFDVTDIDPQPNAPVNLAAAGKMWTRQDGKAFDSGPAAGAPLTGAVVMTQTQDPAQYLTRLDATSSTVGDTTTVKLSLLNAATRFLGVYLQFFSEAAPGVPMTLGDIDEYRRDAIIPNHDKNQDTDTSFFVGMLGSAVTVMAIPVGPAFLLPSFTLPGKVAQVRVLMSGLGSGANGYPGTLAAGETMTGFLSYGMTGFMCALGAAAGVKLIMDEWVTPVMDTLVTGVVAVVASEVNGKSIDTWQFWAGIEIGFAKVVANFLAKGKAAAPALTALVKACAAAAGSEELADDAIPVLGWINFGISVAVGVASLLETSIEVALSPKTYVWDLKFTHAVTVTVTHDGKDDGFPRDATQCIVTATFDDAIPHRQTLALNDPAKPIDRTAPLLVTFPQVPLGGTVSVSVAFIQQALAAQSSILLGRGNSGTLVNGPQAAPAIQITELPFPLGPTTRYQHRQKTALKSDGTHYWNLSAPAPATTQLACGEAGTLCGLRSISVRQGTSSGRGYVGYAWQAQNLDMSLAPGCDSRGAGQFDQMANIGTDTAAGGYAVTTCGFEAGGVLLTYDLLPSTPPAPATAVSRNFYLDTSGSQTGQWHLRQVVLDDSPHFDPPGGQSWGAFNFRPDVLLLHPAGHVISITSANHKMESLRLPLAPLEDAKAFATLLAQTHCGEGSRPGRLTQPLTAGIAADGTIIVLENGDPDASPPVPSRLQALTVGGNPKKHFSGQTGSPDAAYFLELTATPAAQGWTLLDVAVEYTGAIYVLAMGSDSTCRLDVYLHDQAGTQPLCSTPGVNAGKLTVDFWRGVYTLNNDVIARDDSAPPGLTEPSVSLWEPCNLGQTCS